MHSLRYAVSLCSVLHVLTKWNLVFIQFRKCAVCTRFNCIHEWMLSQLILYFQQYTQFNTLINIFYFEISGDTTTVVHAVAAAPSLKSNSALISWGAYTSSLEWYEVGSQKAALVIARTALRQCQRFSVNAVLVRILQQRVHHSSVSHALWSNSLYE